MEHVAAHGDARTIQRHLIVHLWPQCLSVRATELVGSFCQSGKAQYLPLVSTLLHVCQQSSCEVVLMPTSHNDDHGTARSQTSAQRSLVPVVGRTPHGLRASLFIVLNRVVNDGDVSALTSDSTTNTRCNNAIVMAPFESPSVCTSSILCELDSEQFLAVPHLIPRHSTEFLSEVCRVGCEHPRHPWMVAHSPHRKLLGDEAGLAMSRRHEDHNTQIITL